MCFLLVIGLSLLPLVVTKEAVGNKTACNKLEVKEAGDQFFDCFDKNIAHNINDSHPGCGSLVPSIINYVKVGKKSCYNDTLSDSDDKREATDFIKLVQFSMRNGVFQDFVNNSGVKCIAAVKHKISACTMKDAGAAENPNNNNTYRKYDSLWKVTRLQFDPISCKAANRIKHCIQKAMRGNNYCASISYNVMYVGSLFDFMLEQCSTLIPDWMESKPRHNMDKNKFDRGTRTTHALLGLLLALAILAIFYVCFRDCRSPRGQWKNLSDRISISMTNRRTSLVNN